MTYITCPTCNKTHAVLYGASIKCSCGTITKPASGDPE